MKNNVFVPIHKPRHAISLISPPPSAPRDNIAIMRKRTPPAAAEIRWSMAMGRNSAQQSTPPAAKGMIMSLKMQYCSKSVAMIKSSNPQSASDRTKIIPCETKKSLMPVRKNSSVSSFTLYLALLPTASGNDKIEWFLRYNLSIHRDPYFPKKKDSASKSAP